MKTIPRKQGHKSYWISEENLYEEYETTPETQILANRHIMEVKGMPDMDKCNRATLDYITLNYLNQ